MSEAPRYTYRPFLITGCGRSGTRYVSDLLTAAKIRTGWEAILNSQQHPGYRARDYKWLLRKCWLAGDSNWLAVPYLKRIPSDVVVFQTVRHPLKVIRSMLLLRFFGDDVLQCRWRGNPHHVGVACSLLRGLRLADTARERCMAYWYHWNRRCETLRKDRGFPGFLYRLEDLTDPKKGLATLNRICQAVSDRPLLTKVPVVKNVHRMFNRHDRELTWDDLPSGALKDSVRQLAHDYGYHDDA